MDERRELLLRRSELSALVQHPAWEVLRARVGDHIERIKLTLGTLALTVEGLPIEEQHYKRGFVAGMRYVLNVTESAETKLTEMLKEGETSGVERS